MTAKTPHEVLRRCASWGAFVGHIDEQATSKAVGDLFELLVRLRLQTSTEFRTQLADVWLLDEVPRSIARKLNLPSTDEGIDLIARTVSGQYWAIQAKYRSDADRALRVKDLSGFSNLAFNVCNGISAGILAHTSGKPIRKRDYLGNVVELALGHWEEMTDEEWAAINAKAAGKTTRPTPRKPRPHQQAAIKDAARYFAKESRGKLIMPCASGKSLTAFWIAQKLNATSVVVAVPSLALIKQSIRDWTREYLAHGVTPHWLAVCSDDTVGDVSKDEWVADVYEMGIPATTDQEEIGRFLKGARPDAPHVIFTSYQSGHVLAKAIRASRKTIDLCILDEAHKTVGDTEKRFSTLLADENLPARNRLFMTATERVLSGSGERERVYSMDDPAVYGKVFHLLTFKQAIADNIICDYRILTVAVTESEVNALIEQNALLKDGGDKDREHEAAAIAAGVALHRTFEKYGTKHAISFHRSIKAARDFASQQDALAGLGVIGSDVVNGFISSEKSTAERDALMREFVQADKALMSNARCLTEGVDVPAIDCVLFASPKQSVVDIVQAAGRAMRPYDGKEFGYILLPIVVPDGMEFDEFAETTAFRTVARTIAALSSQDARIVEYFRATTEGKTPSGKIIEIDGNVPVGMRIDFKQFAAAVETRVWSRVGKLNWRPYAQARAFVHGLGLRNWMEWQRFCREGQKPWDIPNAPQCVYMDHGWISQGDWLGTGSVATHLRVYRSFEEARKFVRTLRLRNNIQWRAYCRSGDKPTGIPANPHVVYKHVGWTGYGDWLGTGAVAPSMLQYRPFEKARKFIWSLGIKNNKQWIEYCNSGKKPEDIPRTPRYVYRDSGWVSSGDWFGTGFVSRSRRQYRSFEDARRFARSLGLTNVDAWRRYCKRGDNPKDIPANPRNVYVHSGWIGWGDWLGTQRMSNRHRRFRPFTEARAFARTLKLADFQEWIKYCASGRRPEDIPTNPQRSYKQKGWAGWKDWLGTADEV